MSEGGVHSAPIPPISTHVINVEFSEVYHIHVINLRFSGLYFIGKLDNKEVNFIATKADVKNYIQVTESMNAPETRERELSSLRKIPDNYETIVIAVACNLPQDQNGIKIVGAVDFLLSE